MRRCLVAVGLALLILVAISCRAPHTPLAPGQSSPVPTPTDSVPPATQPATRIVLPTITPYPSKAGWVRISPYRGFSFAYPEDWRFSALATGIAGEPPYLDLLAPAQEFAGGNLIHIGYETSYEIDEGQSLPQWADWRRFVTTIEPFTQTLVSQTEVPGATGGGEWQIMQETCKGGFGLYQRFYVRYGRLVIIINAYTAEEYAPAMLSVLTELARSIQFAPDAPKTLTELTGTNRVRRSLETAVLRKQMELTPAPFCDAACIDARARATATAKSFLQSPLPTPTPTMGEFERMCHEQFTLTLTREAQTTRTLTPMPTNTPAPIPTARAGFALFRSQDYKPQPGFQVSYKLDQWQLEGTDLKHRSLAGCIMRLQQPGMEVLSPMIKDWVQIAGYSWETRSFPADGIISYGLSLERRYYGLGVSFPKDSSAEAAKNCRSAVEVVINTFEIVCE